jgi:very-short-patch-repair endonuclease
MSTLAEELSMAPERISLGSPSALEATFALHLRADKVPEPVREHMPIVGRKFRIDFAWPKIKFGVEVDGEVHRIKERFHGDIEKGALLLLAGWAILHVSGREVRSGQALVWTKAALWERT